VSRAAPPFQEAPHDPRTAFARSPDRSAQSPRGDRSFELFRGPVRDVIHARADAERRCLRPTSALRNTEPNTRARRLPAQPPLADALRRQRPTALVPWLSPRAHPRDVASRAAPLARRREDQAPRGSGPLDASETGEGRVFTTRSPLRPLPIRCSARRNSSAWRTVQESRWHPCRLLLAHPPRSLFAFDEQARRPPRPVPRGPRERRTLSRSGTPSIARQSPRLPPAPRCRAVHEALFDRADVHVMRIAALRRTVPRSPRAALALSRSVHRSKLGPRPPASCLARAFDPCAAEGALL